MTKKSLNVAQRSGVILVVEDEEPVRRLATLGLQECGYTVLSAVNGRDALGLVKTYGKSIDLIVTDMIMPEMSGRELIDATRRDHPEVKVLFMSGYTDRSLSELTPDVETYLLPKPFTPHVLAQKVEELLGQNLAHS